MSRNLPVFRPFWHISFIGAVLLLVSGLLVACGSSATSPGSGSPTGSTSTIQTHTFDGKLSVMDIPDSYTLPGKIVLGPDHNLWFPAIAYGNFGTSQPSGAIGRLAPDGTFHMFPMPTPNSYPTRIVFGPDGNLWFTLIQGDGKVFRGIDTPPHFGSVSGLIGRMTLDGQFKTFAIPSAQTYATGITVGPDGNLWFTEVSQANNTPTNGVGRLTPSGTFTEYPLKALKDSDYTGPIIAGPDGNLWFAIGSADANSNAVGEMGRITTQGTVTVFPVGTYLVPSDLVVGPDNNLWFSASTVIGRIASDGKVQTFTPANSTNQLSSFGGLTVGGDGAIWFATAQGAVGRVTTDGTFKFYPFPSDSSFDNGRSTFTLGQLKGIVSGADGTLWLTDNTQIGHFI